MPKTPVSKKCTLNNYLSLDKCLVEMGSGIYCNTCCKQVNFQTKTHISQHLNSANHKSKNANLIASKERQTQLKDSGLDGNKEYNLDVVKLCAHLDVPFSKLDAPAWIHFTEKYIPKYKSCHSTNLTKSYLPTIYNEVIEKVKAKLAGKRFYAIVDECTDIAEKSIFNILVGALTAEDDNDDAEAGESYLIASFEVQEMNGESVAKVIDEKLCEILGVKQARSNLFYLVSDAAPYMVKAGRLLQVFYTKLNHVTCIVHGISRVCSFISDEYVIANTYLSKLKQVFLHSKKRRRAFKEANPDLPLPPDPAPTRFGKWLEAIHFSATHFEPISMFFLESPEEKPPACLVVLKELLRSDILKTELTSCSSMFSFLPQKMEILESNKLKLTTQLEILHNIHEKLKNLDGEVGARVLDKFEKVIQKNKGLKLMEDIAQVLQGEEPSSPILFQKYTPDEVQDFKFAQLSSCDVERSFSKRKSLLRPQRLSFKDTNLEMLFVVNFNSHFYK